MTSVSVPRCIFGATLDAMLTAWRQTLGVCLRSGYSRRAGLADRDDVIAVCQRSKCNTFSSPEKDQACSRPCARGIYVQSRQRGGPSAEEIRSMAKRAYREFYISRAYVKKVVSNPRDYFFPRLDQYARAIPAMTWGRWIK